MPGADTKTVNQSQQSVTNPWEPAQPLLKDLLAKYGGMNTDVTGGQASALDNLTGAASGIPNFGASSSDAIRNLFSSSTAPQVGMLSDAYNRLQGNLGATASGANLNPYSTPGFSDALATMTSDITDKTKAVYAGAGRDPSGSGSFSGSLGRGLTEGIAPVIANQYNTNAARMDAANNTLFGGAGSTASGITNQNQTQLSNAANAIGMVPNAAMTYTMPGATQLSAADARYSQPWKNLAALLNPVAGIAGLGGQSSGSGSQQSTVPQNLFANIMGGVSGGVGLLSLLSDERAKEGIQEVGMLNDGQPIYRYRYRGSDIPQIGLLAQRVMETNPDAVEEVGGLLRVDYGKATDAAARMTA